MNYTCKIASISEMTKKWDYEIEIATHDKENWLYWKKEHLENKKNGKQNV